MSYPLPFNIPTPKRQALFFDCTGQPIFEDSTLYCFRWGVYTGGLYDCFLWHLTRSRTGKLVLVADGIKKRLPMTTGQARRLKVYSPSKQLRLADFAEEWSWWRASGWGIYAEDYDFIEKPSWQQHSGISVRTYRKNTSGGFVLRAGEQLERALVDPAFVRQLLTDALYHHVHPRQAARLPDSEELPPATREAFVKEMRRKAKKLGFS